VPPVLAFNGIVLPAAALPLPQLTRDFFAQERRFFGGRMASRHLLGHALVENKGAELGTLAGRATGRAGWVPVLARTAIATN
jgi:hypothetical protein